MFNYFDETAAPDPERRIARPAPDLVLGSHETLPTAAGGFARLAPNLPSIAASREVFDIGVLSLSPDWLFLMSIKASITEMPTDAADEVGRRHAVLRVG